MGHIYRGIIPFVCLQVIAVVLCMAFPDLIFYLPRKWGLLD
jgi:TRAP-type mannitol/chloroaromatic compound transport system permease large subunit